MQPEHLVQVRALFAEALEQPAASREAFVRERASDPAIAAEVLRLMGLDEQPKIHTLQGVQAMADAEAAPLAQGRRVGKFELFEVLGEGGMGQVYRARRVDGPEHWVAVKLMRRGLFNAASETRFLAEQQFLARLNHPNIAHYIDSGFDADGHVYVAMELVQGQRLLDFAKAKALNAKQRVTLFRQLLAAVSYAHRQLIIHRDLKQANVLVTADGVVKLLDFGIAKLLQDQSQMTGTIERLYTPTCAAPEQIRGEPCDVTTDVYALGVLLYELIAGKSIFDTEGKTPGEFENLVLNVPPSDMKSRVHPDLGCADIPTDLERIVAKAIRKEPNRRYGSVEQFDADLERLLNNEPVSVSGNGFLYRTQKFLSRNKLASGLTALIAIAVLSGLVTTLQQNREIRAERDRANLALDAMKQAFLGADPWGEVGGEVTAKDILSASTEKLLPLLKTGNSEFIDLATVLLEVQLSMGLDQDARRTHQLLPEQLLVENSRLCILSAGLLVEDRVFEAADQLLNQCHDSNPEDTLLRQMTLARYSAKRLFLSEAAVRYNQVHSNIPCTNPLWIAAVTQDVTSLIYAGKPSVALGVVDAAIARANREIPFNETVMLRLELAKLQTFSNLSDSAKLIEKGEALLAHVRAKYGQDSLVTGRIESLVGLAFVAIGDNKSSLPYFVRSKEAFTAVRGPLHRDTLRQEANYLMRYSRVYPDDPTIHTRFEDLIISSDQPEIEGFKVYVQVDYGRWLSLRHQYLAAFRAFLSIDRDALSETTSEDETLFWSWLNYSYWKNECAADPSETYSPRETCNILPRKIDTNCTSARAALCGIEPLRIENR